MPSASKTWHHKATKPHTPEYEEGPQAFERFKSAMKHVLSVPHAEVQQIEAHRREVAKNPHKRGPKSKKRLAAFR